jgi:pimeloyl-ACP methyl ester carboxylesterase
MYLLKAISLAAASICFVAPALASGAKTSLPETKFLNLPQGKVAFDDSGAGPLVIAVPGMGDLRNEYRYLKPLLIKAGYRVVTVDVRGMGESTAHWDDYSARAVGRDLVAIINQLGVPSAVVIGTSFAAGAALWAAYEQPEKIKKIVMISPILEDQPLPFYKKAALAAGFAGPWRVALWSTYWDSLFARHKPSDHRAYRAALVANLKESGRMDALTKMVKLSKADTAAIIGKIAKPAVIVIGSRDKDFSDPIEEGKSLASRTGANLVVAEGAGHYPHVEMPGIVGNIITQFIEKGF